MFQVDEQMSPLDQPRCAAAQAQCPKQHIQASPAKKTKKDDDVEFCLVSDMGPFKSGAAAAAVQNNPSPHAVLTGHHLWANLLALKMDKMNARSVEDFKLKVDTMALNLMELD